jgi:hypothetical protein
MVRYNVWSVWSTRCCIPTYVKVVSMRDFNGHTENIWKNLTDRMGCRLGDVKCEI